MTAWSRSGGESTPSQVGRLVTAGLTLLLLGLLGVCCSLAEAEHDSEAAAVQAVSISVPVSSVSAEGQVATSAAGCSESEGHSAVEGARLAGAPSSAAGKPDLADAPHERRTSPSSGPERPAEHVRQSPAASSAFCRAQVVLQV
ncbi:hypothetical protein [Streptomyces sp. NPDC000410]|uniref:hypothetical protein n=1 Tax=Streptomyces sp. NPDC000410 TaxID=3154254 RepID=UPI003327D9E2